MFKIQVLNPISEVGLGQFPSSTYEVAADIPSPDAILVRSFDLHAFDFPATLKAVGRAGAGLNNIPVAALTKKGIPVFNTPGANANAVRELVIAGMLLASRNIYQAWSYVSELAVTGKTLESEIEKNKKQFVGFEVMGKTLGVIGLGNIGVKVANVAVNLGMHVIGYDPTISIYRAWELSSSVRQATSMTELLGAADFVSIHVPLTNDTKHLMNVSTIRHMKQGAVLLNFARAEIVDEGALAEALQENKLYAYVSDFPTGRLLDNPKVIHLPHLGASTKEAEENCAVMIVKAIRDFLEQGIIANSANFPTVEITQRGVGSRLTVVNENVPNMVAQISSVLAKANMNIASLANKSRDNIAYNVIDLENKVNKKIIEEIMAIQGVIQVREL